MAAAEDGKLTTRHWVLIAAAGVLAVILLAKILGQPTEWRSGIVALAALAVAVTSLLNMRKRKTN